ncbi:MAG: leucine-rich repeat domain-containing protein [Bacteroidaceae bacterium]|nr:leucine-rich repeat domain-containing protein [Bacteroidaceae bacterium]
MKKLPILLFMLLLPLAARAFVGEAVIDGIKYYIVTKANTAEVRSNNYTGDIVIPKTIKYDGVICDVVTISAYAFDGCTSLTSVTIPNSVTFIDAYAFSLL